MSFKSGEIIPCTICGGTAIARRLCKPCYYRLRKKGLLGAHGRLTATDVFWTRIDKSGTCWNWTGASRGDGYGVITMSDGRIVRAHRFAYEATHGPIPAGLVVMHACDNRACCNPAHLSVGTRGDNHRDAVAKGRNAFGERSGHARLSSEEIAEIRADTRTHALIAASFGTSQGYVSMVRNWKVRRKG